MSITRRHWLVAFIVALVAHGAFAAAFYEADDPGAKALGRGGVEVSLGTAGGVSGAQEVQPAEAETLDAPVAEDVPVDAAEVAPVPEVAAISEPTETIPIEQAVEKAVDAPPPPTEHAALRVKPAPPEVKPKDVPVEVAAHTPPTERPAEKSAKEAKAQPAGTTGNAGTRQGEATGDSDQSSSGGAPGSSASYFASLQAWLERHKEYPSSARRRRQQGTVILTFSFDRDGQVRHARIDESSGFKALDHEVLEMLRRAEPLPRFPEDIAQNRMTISIPIQFYLH